MDSDAGDEPTPLAYSLRRATADDVDFIHGLRVAGLLDRVARIWGWDEAEQRARFGRLFQPDAYQVIVIEGWDVGAIAVAWTSAEALLADIELLPGWRGRGLGTAIIGNVLDEARGRRLPVTLQVLKGNPARRLYDRLGFQIVGETTTHFSMLASPHRHVSGVDAHPARC